MNYGLQIATCPILVPWRVDPLDRCVGVSSVYLTVSEIFHTRQVDIVRCRLDNKLYIRKSVEKRVVARNPAVSTSLFDTPYVIN
jgi:hypothetical protein